MPSRMRRSVRTRLLRERTSTRRFRTSLLMASRPQRPGRARVARATRPRPSGGWWERVGGAAFNQMPLPRSVTARRLASLALWLPIADYDRLTMVGSRCMAERRSSVHVSADCRPTPSYELIRRLS